MQSKIKIATIDQGSLLDDLKCAHIYISYSKPIPSESNPRRFNHSIS